MANILVIDDDDQFRKLLLKILEKEGYGVTEAADGKKGIQQYQHSPADLVLTDIVMPDKEGIETIMDLRRLNPHVKIIAMSGGGQIGAESYLDIAKKLGAHQTLTKPINRQELLSVIKKALDSAT